MFRRRLRLCTLESRLAPATFTVDALTDSGAGSGLAGDLRYCIAAANSNPGPDTIEATGVTGVILLTGELPTISDDLTVTGPGAAKLTIDGQLGSRLVQVSTSGGKQIDFSNLTFTGGSTTSNGGAVSVNNATAVFSNCVLTNSSANFGGLVAGTASSTISIVNCTLSGSTGFAGAGAVYSAGGTLSIRNSTLSGNSTGPFGSGGAVVVSGGAAATITNSTLSGNSAGANGGAIRTTTSFSGELRIRNCTITQNLVIDSAGFGRGVSKGGGGGTVIIDSTIVAQNSGGALNTSDVAGSFEAAYSLFGTTDNATITGSGNFKGTNAAPVDAKLGPLANNGGPTLTHLPADDSSAREAGENQDGQTEDQRGFGFARTEGYTTDIGAVETLYYRPMAKNIYVIIDEASPATTQQFTVTYYDPRGSGLVDYSSLGTNDLYIVAPTSYLLPTFISATPAADANTIVATYEIPVPVNGKAGWDVSDNGVYALITTPGEVFDRDSPTPLEADNVAFTFLICDIADVYIVDEASDVIDMKYGFGELSFREALLLSNTDNKASKIRFSNAAFAGASTITMTGGEYELDTAVTIIGPAAPLTLDAGGTSRIFRTTAVAAGAEFSISNLALVNGSVTGDGGGIFFDAGKLNLNNVTVSNCKAHRGGGIYAKSDGVVVSLTDCQVGNNSATLFGGGILLAGTAIATGRLNLLRTTIADNSAIAVGAGLCLQVAGFTIDECALTGNVAGNGSYVPIGGAIGVNVWAAALPLPQFTIRNSTLSDNIAYKLFASSIQTGGGGAIAFYQGPATLDISNSTIVGNSSGSSAGGVYIVSNGNLRLESTLVAGNKSVTGPPDMSFFGAVQGVDNLIGVADVGYFTLEPGNVTGTKVSPLDAKLAPLADNGGPTKTHALLPGSPAINAGSNLLGLLFDQRGMGFDRVVGAAADIGAFEVQSTPTPPAKVASYTINDGAAQRSRVTSVTVTFDSAVTLPANPEEAFELKQQGTNTIVTLDGTVNGNSVTLTFIGGPLNFGSLTDGRYTLTALAAKINGGNFDGNGDGTGGDDYVLVGTPANGLFRLFGDADGDGDVDAADFGAFRGAIGGVSNLAFDSDGDGDVDAVDFGQFRQRFGSSI